VQAEGGGHHTEANTEYCTKYRLLLAPRKGNDSDEASEGPNLPFTAYLLLGSKITGALRRDLVIALVQYNATHESLKRLLVNTRVRMSKLHRRTPRSEMKSRGP